MVFGMALLIDTKEIFAKFKDRIYRLALSITRNERDAEDVMQNTFLQVIKNLRYFRHEALLTTWIYRIAYNEALMALRKRRSQSRLSGSLKYSMGQGASGLFVNWSKLPDQQLLDGELKERIDSAIKRMPIQYRMALLLDNVEGLPLKNSARILNLKINSLKTRLRRARLLIKTDIENYFRDQKERQDSKKERGCGVWTAFIYNYSRGSLGKRRSRAFKSHIKDCAGCNSFLDNYQKAIDITRALQCQDLPRELKNKIETFLLSKHQNIKKKEARYG